MRRVFIGALFVLHGLAHSAFGMSAQDLPGTPGTALSGAPRTWLATVLFVGASPGFVAAGFGVWGALGLERAWPRIAYAAAVASAALLFIFPRGVIDTGLGLSLDVAVVLIAMGRLPQPLAAKRASW